MIFHLYILEFIIHTKNIPTYPILYRSLSPGLSPFSPAAGGNVTTGAGTSPTGKIQRKSWSCGFFSVVKSWVFSGEIPP
jgi:hypothetical protein